MVNANTIVDVLLEGDPIRVCAGCCQEHGVKSPLGASHGFCRRHAMAAYQQVLDMCGNDPDTQQKLAALADKPDSSFCPEMR